MKLPSVRVYKMAEPLRDWSVYRTVSSHWTAVAGKWVATTEPGDGGTHLRLPWNVVFWLDDRLNHYTDSDGEVHTRYRRFCDYTDWRTIGD